MKKNIFHSLVASVALLFGASQASAALVDLELALVIDVSGSVNTTEYNLQMDGYAAAFRDAGVQALIAGSANGISVDVIFFADSAATWVNGTQFLTDITGVNAFADLLDNVARPGGIGSSTGIANGITLATSTMATNGFEGTNRVIDVSGDGQENVLTDTAVRNARDAALAAGIVINGLPIGNSTLETYYTNNVTGGAGSFVILANDFASFDAAVKDKINLEIQQGTAPIPAPIVLILSGLAYVAYRRKANK